MKSQKFGWFVAIATIVLSTAGIVWALWGRYALVLTQSSLQSRIDSNLPHQTPQGVNVTSARLDLTAGKISVKIEADLGKLRQKVEAKGSADGTLKYDAKHAAFFFFPDKLTLDEVHVNGLKLPQSIIDTSQKGLDAVVLKAVQQAFERSPIYTLPTDLKGNAARMVIDDVEVQHGQVLVQLAFWRLRNVIVFLGTVLLSALIFALFLLINRR